MGAAGMLGFLVALLGFGTLAALRAVAETLWVAGVAIAAGAHHVRQ